eukprot:CAMPEP_0115463818 /NCGR_PEP_ID=MMETSP0271-20121206/48556_1 /TAXON_ID=71861 /ORGANISM="Scrippsiella trochoidea, Strain CCMP3099" /LENGTH=283 /DNA_ID=CAMNT_0002890689 /DNA_START=30 /DNA_END=878 /DNA_ORIENTATION=+
MAADEAPLTATAAAAEGVPSQGVELPAPIGLPEGWKCYQKRYLTGPTAGQPYVRFTGGADFKHKGILSVRAAIRKDAEDKGLDPDEEVAKYDKVKQEKAEALAKAKEEAGRLSGAKREEAINRFREKLGTLDGPTCQAITGWKCEFSHSVNCNQTHVTYIDPEGIRYVSLKDIECCLGFRMRNNADEIVELVKEARTKANPSNFARASHTARQSAYSQGTASIASLFTKGGGGGGAKAESPGGDREAEETAEERAEQPNPPSTPPAQPRGAGGGGAVAKGSAE